ncbi:MAG: DUF3592 domain-containing protein [bacterium]|nr:DUF3592 domain-containing protein [bacterium]
MKYLLSTFMILFAASFIAIGWNDALQQEKGRYYNKAEAVIITCRVEEKKSKKGNLTFYIPLVEYRFKAGGKTYTGRQVEHTRDKGSLDWAKDVIGSYRVGTTVTAFYRIAEPTKAYLVPSTGVKTQTYPFKPYVFILIPLLFVTLGIFGFFIDPGMDRDKIEFHEPERIGEDKYKLHPTFKMGNLWIGFACSFLVSGLICGAALLHFFNRASAPYEIAAPIMAAVFVLFLAALLVGFIYYFFLRLYVTDAQCFIDQPSVHREALVTVSIRQEVLHKCRVRKAAVGIVLYKKYIKLVGNRQVDAIEKIHEDWHNCGFNFKLSAGQVVSFQVPFNIGEVLSTGPLNCPKIPIGYDWEIQYILKLFGAPDYRNSFPIRMID